ncbi:MBL fold metallo-hydrolase [Parabacteroides sp. OttesenSCG-928-G07]|nr:MBL fold metallo-hydrolase [Parabacteroides sp. OttesenSCG-928-G21]MDL2278013.1 MBL fold metallo-hydrolase [Parabacteroides sp. OttesenSCG-928-G07]
MNKNSIVIIFFLLLFVAQMPIMAQGEEEYPFTYMVGDVNVTLLSEGQQQGNVNILTGVTESILSQYAPEGTFPNAINTFLIETSENTILVDAGLGRKLFSNLEVCEKKPEDINVVLLTHMHGDHIGGLLQDGKKNFPNAKLYISRPEHDYWMSDEAMQNVPENRRAGFVQAREVIAAYKDNLSLFTPGEIDEEKQEILPGIQGVAAYGHTPGHTVYLLESDESRLLIWGDLTHAMPVQIPSPQVATTYDLDSAKAIESRQRLLKYVSENKIPVGGMHIEFPGMATIKGNLSDGYKYILTCTCEGVFR